jgi:hypothetical protein
MHTDRGTVPRDLLLSSLYIIMLNVIMLTVKLIVPLNRSDAIPTLLEMKTLKTTD